MIEKLGWIVLAWLCLSCIVGFAIGKYLDYLDSMLDVFNDYDMIEDLQNMTTLELEEMVSSGQLNMDERLAVMDELQKRKGNPQRPTDSQFECFGCGS